MKRKLISFDAFKKIEEASLTKAQDELTQAEEVLAKTLGLDNLELFTFGESDVTYKAADGTFVHASYRMDQDQLVLENVEQLVIEEESEKQASRQVISDLVDAILDDNKAKAEQKFESYINMPSVRRNLVNEAVKMHVAKKAHKNGKGGSHSPAHVSKRIKSRLKTLKGMSKGEKDMVSKKRATLKNTQKKLSVKPITVKEWAALCENVMGFIDYKNFGPVISESYVQTDDRGNVTGVAIPTTQKRNEGKILSFNYKTLDHEVKVLRGKLKKLAEDVNFVRAMSDLKRYNNISDNKGLEETLEAIATRWPDLVYVTEQELADQISTALESANVLNYDDQVCAFMAEAILRTAHNAYTDRVRKIGTLAGVDGDITADCTECKDSYQEFKAVAESLYPKLDESDESDLRVFADLYKALHEVHTAAVAAHDYQTKADVEAYLEQCVAILNREATIDLELAESIVWFLNDLVEANVPGAGNEMDVSNTPHITINGDHPMTAQHAKVAAVASTHNGDWKSPAPVSDGKSYSGNLDSEMGNNGWSNISGNTWPELSNPYVPKAGEFKMKEKSAVDDGESDHSRFQSNDTWPNLKNPYVPASPWEKMKAKSDNLVVDQ